MKVVKSLLLGTAAGLIAVGGAQAADLPMKAKAVEYVKVCSLYGAGFYYIPGTDTCIKLGGYVRADAVLGGTGDYGFNNSTSTVNGGSNNRLTNYYYSRARVDLNVDARTATEYGVVRTYADMVFSYDSSMSPAAIRRHSRPAARRSASTMRSFSSPASPSAAPCRSSMPRGSPTTRAVPIPFRAAPTT